ncbi:unannotated protein [freshwater metagenome]|uniref:Unannotated protein n=1 Tax=freshwater metagenome TaxID=449393 RepID=A0A6J7ATU7_9ZZZZ
MAAWTMSAVVTKSDCFGERDVEPRGASDCGGHLRNLECMREPCALVVGRKHEHLGLASQSAESCSVQDAVAIAFEACSQRIWLLLELAVACACGSSGAGGQGFVFGILAGTSIEQPRLHGGRRRVAMGEDDAFVGGDTFHRPGPDLAARPRLVALRGGVCAAHVVEGYPPRPTHPRHHRV